MSGTPFRSGSIGAEPIEAAPGWLVARPIAHRGLHDRAGGVIENSLSAARAAIARGYAIECDVQLTADGEAMVFHDRDLARLVGGAGSVHDMNAAALAAMPLLGAASGEAPPTLADFLATVAGRVPLVVEIKSRFDGDMRLTHRTLEVLSRYDGPFVVESFDPYIVAEVRRVAPGVPRGIVAETRWTHPDWDFLAPERKHALGNLLHFDATRPHFLSWQVADLVEGPPFLLRRLGIPVTAWTVRDEAGRALAGAHADQMVFEGFLPDAGC
ncbi:glycerophosphodiester phosphodiesterase family protein [Salinarimonas ramus]|uniref:Glycerophosphoryl diester phosphodiesterase n=1 Tax=Salinarimonas ramus TaxID=690164 RepID=A0A917QAW8_9HYPH|nr:glycerophosphodiester phosphodiesterase family protein [Salinarimonas ramus]GGK40080.1 glycerophosphoryl diester phosphodiesterase [Salinarimonas ramus]